MNRRHDDGNWLPVLLLGCIIGEAWLFALFAKAIIEKLFR